MMNHKILLIIPVLIFLFAQTSFCQVRTMGHPSHLFFEYGPLGKMTSTSETKDGSHFAAGIKRHTWIEDRPIQVGLELNYRSISFYDSLEVKHKVGMGEMYLGPRLLISKTSPLYPTASILGGGYLNLDGLGGLSALVSFGIYYNFTEPKTPRNGFTAELTYHTARINFDGYTIPPAFAVRVGFFF